MAHADGFALSSPQIEVLRRHGSELAATAGTVLVEVGARSYPFMVVLEGEIAILDPSGGELARHGPSGFVGETNLLSGQTVEVSAVAATDVRYLAVERDELRRLLFENAPLGDVLLSAFMARREELQRVGGAGIEIIGPRSSEPTRRLVEFARRSRFAMTWRDTHDDPVAAAQVAGRLETELPLVRLPGGAELTAPTPGDLARALGIGRQLAAVEEVDLVIVGGGPAGLGAAVYGASEGLDTLLVEGDALGGQAGTSRRIENYLGFPAGISGADLALRAITQARKFGARTATPYKAVGLEAGDGVHVLHLEGGHRVRARAVVLATGAEYRRLPVDRIAEFEGVSVFYAAGPQEGRLCGGSDVAVIGGGNSAAQAAIWLARGGAQVTLMHRRSSLAETMSEYLIHDLARYGVAVRDRGEITALHGTDGVLEAVTLADGQRMPLQFLFCFLGADPCTDWLEGTLATDAHGFVLTGQDAGSGNLLETSVPGVFAAGDVRAGSVKRCATAVGEGAMVVRLVHEHLARTAV